MLKVFNHNTNLGICTYVGLSLDGSDDYLEIAKAFLYGQTMVVDGKIGFSRLHPEDKNYKKSTGRDIAIENAKDGVFLLIEVRKNIMGRVALTFIHEETGVTVKALASYKKRPHLRLY